MRAAVLVLCAAVVAALLGPCQANSWRGKAACKNDTEHFYQYDSSERYFGTQFDQTSTMTVYFSTVCKEEGVYKNSSAIMYSLTVTNVYVNGSIVDQARDEGDVMETQHDLYVELTAGWFFFVQIDDGAIVATYYDTDEDDDIVNVKKRLAATFQVNYGNGTAVRAEVDPQSAHRSKYSIDGGGGNSTKKNLREVPHVRMTRIIDDEDVVAFSSSLPNEEVDYNRQETLFLDYGVMTHAEGSGHISLLPNVISDSRSDTVFEDQGLEDGVRAKLHRRKRWTDDTYDPSVVTNYYEAGSNYTLAHVGQQRVLRNQRSTVETDFATAMESTLLATVNLTRRAIKSMDKLRDKLGDVHEALVQLHKNTEDTSIARKLETLVKKEAEYGPAPGYTPAVDDILDYLESLLGSTEESDINMRQLLYFIISPEGSTTTQLSLVQSLEDAVSETERENVLFYIAFIANPQPQLVARLEELISSDVNTNDPLLLAYGAIVPRASATLQARMISFLLDRLPLAEVESKSLIHHILALGNTESPETSGLLLDYLGHPDQAVQLTSILSLRSLLNEPAVQKNLREFLLKPDTNQDHIAMMAKALLYGAEDASMKRVPRPYPEDLVKSLVALAANIDDEQIQGTLSRYLETVGTRNSHDLLNLFGAVKSNKYDNDTRIRRGTNWAESNPVYDLVEPLSERQEDVNKYTNHLAYIWGQLFGGKDINLQIAAGGFAGVANNGEYKVYGHAVAQATLYNRRQTFVEFILLRRKTDVQTETKLYGNVMGKVLKDIDSIEEVDVCKTYNEPLYDGKVYTVFDFTYTVFVEVANLDFGAKATVQFTAGLEIAFCDKLGRLTASAMLTPTLTLTVEASGDVEVLFVAKAGLTADAVLNYQLQPGANIEICYTESQVRNKNCIGIYDQWKNNKIDLYAWYAWRGWCGWWACTGDKAYQNKHKIDALSFSWDLPSSPQKTLAEACDADYVCND